MSSFESLVSTLPLGLSASGMVRRCCDVDPLATLISSSSELGYKTISPCPDPELGLGNGNRGLGLESTFNELGRGVTGCEPGLELLTSGFELWLALEPVASVGPAFK